MPPVQLPLTLAQHHRNQQLFSDYYLNVTLPQRAEWRLLAQDARGTSRTRFSLQMKKDCWLSMRQKTFG